MLLKDKDRIRAFLARHIRRRDLADDDDIFQLGFVNSLFAMQLIVFVEREFGLRVEDDDLTLDNFRSINAIAGLVDRKLKAAPA